MKLYVVFFGLLIGTACAASRRAPATSDEAPSWRTEEGQKGVWRDLAVWYIDNGMPDRALEMITRLRESGSDAPELIYFQGRALASQGMPEEARIVLEQARDRMPRDPRPVQDLGIVYAELGLHQEAIATLRRALELDENDVKSRNNLGFLLLAMDECEAARAELERVLAADATNSRYRNNLAFSLVCTGEHSRALQLFRSTGTEAHARYNMGVAFERIDNPESAALQYEKALEVDPKFESAREALSRLEPATPDLRESAQGVE
jgi:Flp pilus assembly protein TadD